MMVKMKTMKAWQVRAWGEPEEMTLAEVPIPEPAPAQIRISNRAAALNFFDILQIQGKYEDHIRYAMTHEEWRERGHELVSRYLTPLVDG